MIKKINIPSFDGYNLNVHIFEADNPKAVIQFCHGMQEYQERYESFFSKLAESGYIVISNNMRGHGEEAPIQGYFGKDNGHLALLKDQETMLTYIKENYPTLPRYIFAHSMGTIIMRNHLQKHSKDYDKVVLSGFPNYQAAAGLGVIVAKMVQAFKGSEYRSKLLSDLSTGQFSKTIKNRKTDLDWLTYDEENVVRYNNDPLCGITFTTAGYKDLFSLLKNLHNLKAYTDVNSGLEFFMISGDGDPCTGGEKGRADSISTLKNAGFNHIQEKVYHHMRHEILNENDKINVIDDIITFYNK